MEEGAVARPSHHGPCVLIASQSCYLLTLHGILLVIFLQHAVVFCYLHLEYLAECRAHHEVLCDLSGVLGVLIIVVANATRDEG